MPAFLQGKDLYVDTYLWPSFIPPFHEVKFCGVPSCVFDKLGCAACEEILRNTDLKYSFSYMYNLACDIKERLSFQFGLITVNIADPVH
jgi:hypothetical protein